MNDFKPFNDEATSLKLDELTIENRLDRIELYGAANITKDKAGLALARRLKAIIDATVATLAAQDLPDRVRPVAPDRIDNPFE